MYDTSSRTARRPAAVRSAAAWPRLLLALALLAVLAGFGRRLGPALSRPAAGHATAAPPARPVVLRLTPPTGLPTPTKAAPVPADTSAAGMTAVWADVRRRSYFLAAGAAEPAPRRATNVAQRLTARLAPAAYTLAAAAPLSAGAAPAAPGRWASRCAASAGPGT